MENQVATTNQNEIIETPTTAMEIVMNCVNTDSRSDKIRLINALDSADEKITDHIGETISVIGIYAETHFSKKQQKPVCRVLLLTNEGKSYATGSFVFMNSLKSIVDVLGAPSADQPLKIQIASQQMERGEALKAKVVE